MELRILCIGDIVGRPGRAVVAANLPTFRREQGIAVCIANAENAAKGSGITRNTVDELLAAGVDLITLGDHTWRRAEAVQVIRDEARVIRPLNYPPGAAGRGWTTLSVHSELRIGVVNLIGRVFMEPNDCPFRAIDSALEQMPDDVRLVVVDMHAEATSEKVAMGWYLDGRVTAVLGSHTHIPTADERILPKGTAYITDMGMTGPYASVIGREVDPVLRKFLTGMYHPFDVATGDVRLCGVLITATSETGRALSIERVCLEAATAT